VGWDDEPVILMIRVEPLAENRALLVTAIDEDGLIVRQSLEQLDGDTAPRTRWLTWGRVPAGELAIVASVYASSSKPAATARVTMQILARR
jgi:hypothetical protein